MMMSELYEKVKEIQGQKWAALALGRTILSEVEAIRDDIQSLPAENKMSEQVVRDYHNLLQSLKLYLLRCGYDM